MHRRSRLSRALVAGALIGATLTLSACSSAVEVRVADKATDPACARVAQHWPKTVNKQESREVSVDSPTVHAWGDPAIIARCGVTSPGPTTDDCIDASGIDWVARRLSDGVAFVSYGREPAIEVLIPFDYAPEPLALGAFAQAARQIPQGEHRCSSATR